MISAVTRSPGSSTWALVGKGPQSGLVIDLGREVDELTVRGNWDEFILDRTDSPVKHWHQ